MHRFPYAVNTSILFTELDVLQRPAAAKAAGFDAIEFWWPFRDAVPTDGEVDKFVRAVADAGVSLVGLNFFAGDMPAGDRGVLSHPHRSGEFADNVDVAVGIGSRLGCTAFNALYGNRLDGATPAEQDNTAVRNLTLAAQAASRIDGTVLVEPVSGTPSYPLKTADDAVAVIERVRSEGGVQNLRLLYDLFHLITNGDDAATAIVKHGGEIGHVQIADSPGRNEPGTGEIDFPYYFGKLAQAGYDGYVALEYKATTNNTPDSFSWMERN